MRAIVMEIEKNQMVVMKNDGTFLKLKALTGAKIGEEIVVSERPAIWQQIYKYTGVAAAIMLVLLGGVQAKAYYTPYGYVNVDINPSIEIGFNKFERVISVKGLNGDGDKVINDVKSVKNHKLEEAVKDIVETASKDNYIKDGIDNDIMLSIYTPDSIKNEAVKGKLNTSVNNFISSQSKKADIINEVVSKADLDRAAVQKVSVGKLILFEKAKAAGLQVTLDDIKVKPVREIKKMINSVKKDENKQTSETKDQEQDKSKENTTQAKEPNDPKSPEFKNKVKNPEIKKPTKEERQNMRNNNGNKEKKNAGREKTDSSESNVSVDTPNLPKSKTKQVEDGVRNKIKRIQERIKQIDGESEY